MRLGILSDLHLCPPGSPPDGWHNPHQFETARERLVTSLSWLDERGVDRIAVLGDLTHHGDSASLRDVVALLAGAKAPVWVLPGNHDLVAGSDALAAAVEAGGNGVVSLAPASPVELGDGWRVTAVGIERGERGHRSLGADPATWGDGPLLVLGHFPLRSLAGACAAAGLKYAGDLLDAGTLAAALEARPDPVVAIGGHLHVRHAAAAGSLLQLSCGAQVESLFEATVVDFGDWPERRLSWVAAPMREPWPGLDPGLAAPSQAWEWDGSWRPA